MIRKKGNQRDRYLASTEASAYSTQRNTLCENVWKGASGWNPFSMDPWSDKCKQNKRPLYS